MSSNFLQRFKGKTQTLSKDGVHEILGRKGTEAYVPNQPPKQQNKSVNKPKSSLGSKNNPPEDNKMKAAKMTAQTTFDKPTKQQNPFLVSNPFYLDEEERERQELQRKQRQRILEETKKAQQAQNSKKDPKQGTKTSGYSRSVDKKAASNKQWVKLGGLGANIGGDQWLERKKKLDKMQQFAEQVKSINAQKPKVPKPEPNKPKQSKEAASRNKALEYSKNIPKPTVKKPERVEPQEEPKREEKEEQQLSELQIYQMKHEQLKKMIHNNY